MIDNLEIARQLRALASKLESGVDNQISTEDEDEIKLRELTYQIFSIAAEIQPLEMFIDNITESIKRFYK